LSIIPSRKALTRVVTSGAMAALVTLGGLAPPAGAASSGWESILGGHIKSASEARRIASQASSKGFRAHVQRISSSNYEAEIFNGGTKRQAAAVCAKAKKAGLSRCSIEQEFHGDGWSK
jgi:hypothetical protein